MKPVDPLNFGRHHEPGWPAKLGLARALIVFVEKTDRDAMSVAMLREATERYRAHFIQDGPYTTGGRILMLAADALLEQPQSWRMGLLAVLAALELVHGPEAPKQSWINDQVLVARKQIRPFLKAWKDGHKGGRRGS
ncbi:MAG: hypothetical protein AAGF20_00825 [Pseudomonadota bacterium]